MGSIVKGKRMPSSSKDVNLDLAKKKVWLVKVRPKGSLESCFIISGFEVCNFGDVLFKISNQKVPKFVAEAWEASEDGAEVAKLTTSVGGKDGWKLTLDPSTTSGLSNFVLKVGDV